MDCALDSSSPATGRLKLRRCLAPTASKTRDSGILTMRKGSRKMDKITIFATKVCKVPFRWRSCVHLFKMCWIAMTIHMSRMGEYTAYTVLNGHWYISLIFLKAYYKDFRRVCTSGQGVVVAGKKRLLMDLPELVFLPPRPI